MKKLTTRLAALALSLSLLLTSCAGGASATTMHLRKTEGSVGVSDGEGKDVEPRDDLGLYSGYGVETQAKSLKNHLYSISPASLSLVATEFTLSSLVTSMVASAISLFSAHRSLAKSQPTPASSAEETTTKTI